ncbi:CPBP family intramembrane glutamic endopeptidase [Geothrix fermentans]|uniref:CPBP family intramembrane glutamic endopeptidase n=1 Tax=Geothrix fermentans TaxID=44676 RepID=UPI00042788CB|nr:CPBP family intramembrane glutamic endopeptidase [Geothrix fermentans]
MNPTEPTPAAAQTPYPGFAQSLLPVFLFFLFTSLLTIPSAVLSILKRPGWAAWALFLGQLGGVVLALKVCLPIGKKAWKDAFPSASVPPGVWPLTLIAMAGFILVIGGVDGWLNHLIPPPAWFNKAFVNMGWPSIVLGAPLTEEPLFRGLILGGFVLRYGTRRAIAYSALLFALIHLNPWQFPAGLVLGAFLGWLTVRTGSLWPAVFAHFLNNLAVTLAHAFRIPILADDGFQPFWMWGLGVLLLGLGLMALARLTSGLQVPEGTVGDAA